MAIPARRTRLSIREVHNLPVRFLKATFPKMPLWAVRTSIPILNGLNTFDATDKMIEFLVKKERQQASITLRLGLQPPKDIGANRSSNHYERNHRSCG